MKRKRSGTIMGDIKWREVGDVTKYSIRISDRHREFFIRLDKAAEREFRTGNTGLRSKEEVLGFWLDEALANVFAGMGYTFEEFLKLSPEKQGALIQSTIPE